MTASGELRLERHAGLDAFEALADRWDALVARTDLDPLCNGARWLSTHARAFARDEDCFAYTVTRASDGELVGGAAFKREPRRGRVALRRIQWLGDGTYDTDYQQFVSLPGLDEAVCRVVLDGLARERGTDAVVLAVVPNASAFLRVLRAELERRGLPIRTLDEAAAAMALPRDFDAYVSRLKKRMRSKVRQALRRAETEEVEWYTPDQPLEPWLAELWDLHTRRWNASGEEGSFANERRRAWYRALLPLEAADGTLALARLRTAAGTVAVQYGLVRGGTYYQIQEGYAPELEAERPGSQLRAAMIRDLIERGVERYDFMQGLSRHKTDWGGEPVPCTTLSFPLPKLLPRAVFAAKNAVQRLRAASS